MARDTSAARWRHRALVWAAPATGFIRPGPLTRRANDEKDGRSGSCEEKSAPCRSQGAQGQARREAGCDQTRSSGGRGSRTASPDRPESLTPPRAEDRPGAPRRRAEGRAEGRRSPRCPQGGGARQGAPRRQENRRAPRRAQGSGSRAGPSGGEEDRGSPGRPEKSGRGRHGAELADVPVELNSSHPRERSLSPRGGRLLHAGRGQPGAP